MLSVHDVATQLKVTDQHIRSVLRKGKLKSVGTRKGFEDSRGNVFLKYIDIIAAIQPTYAVIENVRGLLSAEAPYSDELSYEECVELANNKEMYARNRPMPPDRRPPVERAGVQVYPRVSSRVEHLQVTLRPVQTNRKHRAYCPRYSHRNSDTGAHKG